MCICKGEKKQWSNTSQFFFFYKEVLSDALCIGDLIHGIVLLPLLFVWRAIFLHEQCNREGKKSHRVDLYISLQQLKFPCFIKLPLCCWPSKGGLAGAPACRFGWLSCLPVRCAQSMLRGLSFSKVCNFRKQNLPSFVAFSTRQIAVQG